MARYDVLYQTPADHDSGRRGDVTSLFLVSLAYSLASGMLRPFVPMHATALGASPLQVGFLVSLSSLLPIVFTLHVGLLADRFGAKNLIVAGTILLIFSAGLRGIWYPLGGLAVAQVVFGLSQLLFFLAAQSYVAECTALDQRTKYFGIWTFYTSLGQLLGPLAGGVVVNFLLENGKGDINAYRGLAAAAVGAVIPALMLMGRLSRTSQGTARRRAVALDWAQAWRVASRPLVATAAIATFAIMFSTAIRQSFFPILLASRGYPILLITVLYSANPLASLVIRPFMGILAKPSNQWSLMGSSLILIGVGWALVPLVSQPLLMFALVTLAGVGMGVGTTLTMTIAAAGAIEGEHGLALALRQVSKELAETIAPLVFGLFTSRFGVASAHFTTGVAAAVGIVSLMLPPSLRSSGHEAPAERRASDS